MIITANRKKVWEGVGATINDRFTVDQALNAGRLNWEVGKEKLYLEDGTLIDDKVAVVRQDNQKYLGVVGHNYEPVQNHEQAEFIKSFVGEGNIVESVGMLNHGKRVFWAIKAPDYLVIGDDDRIDKYFMLVNGHDGTLAFKGFETPIRISCSNMLNAMIKDKKKVNAEGFSIRHSRNIKSRIEEVKNVMSYINRYYEKIQAEFQRFYDEPVADAQVTKYFETVLKVDDENRSKNRVQQVLTQVDANHKAEVKTAGRSTIWQAYNAITEYTTHQMRIKKTKRFDSDNERNLNNVMFGTGRHIQQRAFDQAQKLITATV